MVDGGGMGSITAARVLEQLRQHTLLLAAATVLGAVAAWFYLSRATPIYEATALLEMTYRRPRVTSGEALIGDTYESKLEVLNTRLVKLQSAEMAARAADILRAERQGLPIVKLASDETLQALLTTGSKWRMRRDTMILEVRVQSPDAAFAAAGANAIAQAAELTMFDDNRAISENAVAWLRQQAVLQRENLANAEQTVVQLRTSHSIDALKNAKTAAEASLLELHRTLLELEITRDRNRAIETLLQDLGDKPQAAGGIPPGIPSEAAIRMAHQEWQAAVAARNTLLERYTAQHPNVEAAAQTIQAATDRLQTTLAAARVSAENQSRLLENNAAGLRAQIKAQAEEAANLELRIVQAEAEIQTSIREREAADIAYRGVLERIEEARMAAEENTAVLKRMREAVAPTRSVYPRPLHAYAIGLSAGFVLALLFVLIVEAVEDRVTSIPDLEQQLGLRILGLVPKQKDTTRRTLAHASLRERFGQVAEVFAGVRGMIFTGPGKSQFQAVLVASTAPEEGKTIAACNLAGSCALSGSRVLLVDFDMRRPRLASIFGAPQEHPSLLHELAAGRREGFGALALPSGVPNLDVIVSRASSQHSPAEVIGSPSVAVFLEWARSAYERVIIDSPPFGLISDSSVLANAVDGVILVCRPKRSRRGLLRRAMQFFAETHATLLGVIVNDIDYSKRGFLRDNLYYNHYYHAYAPQDAAPK